MNLITTGVLALSLVSLAALGTGCASPVDPNAPDEAVASDDAELRASGGISLANGADVRKDNRPDKLRVIAKAGDAKAKVTDTSLADCAVTKNASLSTSTRTVFDITLDYEIDDGWNGCNFEFTARGYKAHLTAGFDVTD